MPVIEDITIYRGEDIELNFTMSPLEDITDWDIEFNVVGINYAKLITVVAEITDGSAGTFTVTLLADSTDIRTGLYTYDVWHTDPDVKRVIATGTLTVLAEARIPAAT